MRIEDVKPGQVWRDKDQRPPSRRLVVVSIHPHVIHNPAYARMRNLETGRESGVQLRRLVTSYELVTQHEASHGEVENAA